MNKRKIIVSSFLGNALEFYDFTLYGAFAILIGQTFFPSGDALSTLLQTLGVFAVGFVMRPFGAAIFGAIGDKFGRKKALQLSILLMGIPTFLIGLMPSYESIGLLAPVLVILCRLLQGLCTGGEYNGAAIFALEHMGKDRPGLVGGIITSSCGVGAFVAMGLSLIVCAPGMPTWAWRIPFLLGTIACFWGWHIRKSLEETEVFKRIQEENKTVKFPLKDALMQHKMASFITFVCGALDGVLSYISFVFLEIFLEVHRHFSASTARGLTFFSIVIFTLSAPLGGHLFDKFKGKPVFLALTFFVIVMVIPAFQLLEAESIVGPICACVLFGWMAGSITGALHAFVQHLFPVKERYSGISFSFSVGISFGSLTPLILTQLVTHSNSTFSSSLYVLAWGLLSFWAFWKAKPTWR